MPTNPVACFLQEFFHRLGEEQITYCVLKNFDHLPEKPGRDVDMWIKEDHFQKSLNIMFAVAKNQGWEIFSRSIHLQSINAGSFFFIKDGNPENLCEMDVSPFLHWKGISYLNERVFPKNIYNNKNGIKVASPGLEAATMIFRGRMGMMGELKEEYKPKIVEHLRNDPQGFLELLGEPFGKQAAEAILGAARSEDWDYLGQKMAYFHRVILQRALWRRPFYQIRQWVRYYAAIWRARFSPPHGFFLTLLGPDGAGKTTIAKLLVESEVAKKLFPRRKYFYRRFEVPWKKVVTAIKGAGGPKFETEVREDGAIVPMEPFQASIYALYLALEYFTGHGFLRWWKSNAGLVVFDRYFFDYLVFEDFQRAPSWLLRLLARIVPRPDALIYLQNDPETIHARKAERSVPEIARQVKICEELVTLLPPAYIIETSKRPEEIIEEIKGIIIRNLLKRNRHSFPY